MKKYILPIILSTFLVLPFNLSSQTRTNYHRGQNKTEKTTGNNRPGGSGRPGNGTTGNNRPGNNKNDKKGNDKGQGNHHNGGYWNGNSGNRPGGNHNNPPIKPGNPHHRPGGTPGKPGNNRPGWGHGSSVTPPGMGSHRNHPPRLGYMVNHAIRGGRYDNVWMVAPGQYAVRFYRNGCYYMQYIWPETGRYGTPFRVIMSAPGEWYAYGNRNQWYYEDGNSLRISLNGSYLSPWTLIPSIELNINL